MKTNPNPNPKNPQKGQKQEKDHSNDYLKVFICVVLSLLAVVYFIRFSFSEFLSADIIFGQTIFKQSHWKDLLVFAFFLILFIFWIVFTGTEKRKLLLLIFLNILYFLISYFSFFGFTIKTGQLNLNVYFVIILLFFVFLNYISTFIFAIKYINKKRGTYIETIKCFGSRIRRRYYVQKATNKAFVVSGVGAIIIWSIFMAILLNGAISLMFFGTTFLFFGAIYLFAYSRLVYLKKIAKIEDQ